MYNIGDIVRGTSTGNKLEIIGTPIPLRGGFYRARVLGLGPWAPSHRMIGDVLRIREENMHPYKRKCIFGDDS